MKSLKSLKLPAIACSLMVLASCADTNKKTETVANTENSTELYGENSNAYVVEKTGAIEDQDATDASIDEATTAVSTTTYGRENISKDARWSKSSELYTNLGLSDKQKAQFEEWQVWEMNSRHIHDNNEKKMAMKDYDEKLKSFLTEEQYTKFKKWEESNPNK